MENKHLNVGSITGGLILIILGGLALLGQFTDINLWSSLWPVIIVGFGLAFFAGMVAGGKSTAPLAIPGSILTGIGLMMFVQNATGYWQSWAYGWTVILISVGVGIYLMGRWGQDEEQRQSGIKVVKIGLVMFIIFGAFFESIFRSSQLSQLIFPIGLILLGAYLVLSRTGIWPGAQKPAGAAAKSGSKK